MAFSAVPTKVLGDSAPASDWNTYVRDNFTAYASHDHGSTDDGALTLGESGGLVSARFTDAAAPAAPGAGDTRMFSVSGKMGQRAGASGAAEEFSVVGHGHTFGVDVHEDLTTYHTDGVTDNIFHQATSVVDGEDIESKTDTYSEETEVAIAGGMLANGNHGGTVRVAVRLLFDGSTLQTSSVFIVAPTWQWRFLKDTVSIAGGAGGSKIALLEWNNTGATAAMQYVGSYLHVIAFDRT